jgi:transcriptional regulator with XRE-family HTH domain
LGQVLGLRQARRARGWTQARLIHEIEQYARRHGSDIATSSSLKVYVSDWENGQRPIPAKYAAILRAVLGHTDDELLGDAPRGENLLADGYGLYEVSGGRGVP